MMVAMQKRPLADLPSADRLAPFDMRLELEGHYDYLHADGTVWDAATDAEHARFSQVLFSRVTLDGGKWAKATLSDVRFQDCRLLAVELSGSQWRDAEIVGGLASGLQWHGVELRRVAFDQVKLDTVNFRNAKLADVVFTDCLLREADFAGAALTRVSFPGCTFERADFSRAKLAQVDLRGARLDVARGLDSLRGATIDTGQLLDLAPAFAVHLGITVRDAA